MKNKKEKETGYRIVFGSGYIRDEDIPESELKSGEHAISYRQGNLYELHDFVNRDAIIKIGFVKPKK